jgi:hypothetical protein
MSTDLTIPARRRDLARETLAGLGPDLDEHLRLVVRCPRSHTVAYVYDTDEGLVYRAVDGRHSHAATARSTGSGHLESDFVEPVAAAPTQGDTLPAWCECGPHSVSRRMVLDFVRTRCRVLRLR